MLGGELGCRLGVDLQPEEVANHLDVLEPGAGARDLPLLLRDAEVPGLAGLPDLELVGPDHLFGLLLELLYATLAELYLGGELRPPGPGGGRQVGDVYAGGLQRPSHDAHRAQPGYLRR